MAEDNVKAQMRKGILEYCILAILSREDSYAPKIISELKQAEMIVVEGTLYPILKPPGTQDDLQRRHAAHPLGGFARFRGEHEAQFTRKRGPRQIVVAGRIDDNSVQIEYAAVYHFLIFGYQRYDFFRKKCVSGNVLPTYL